MVDKTPKMATIKETAELFNLPEHFVRQKVKSGEIVAVEAGNKYLVNVDKFLEYLNTHTVTKPDKKGSTSGSTPGSTPITNL